MEANHSLKFLLEGSFIIPNHQIRNPVSCVPSSREDSELFKYIDKMFFGDFNPKSVFDFVLRHHLENKRNYYKNPRQVVVIPKKMPESVFEGIQIIRSLTGRVFSTKASYLISNSRISEGISCLTEWQKYILQLSLDHFHQIVCIDDIFSNDEERSITIKSILGFYSKLKGDIDDGSFFCAQFVDSRSNPIYLCIYDNIITDIERKQSFVFSENDSISENSLSLTTIGTLSKESFRFSNLDKVTLRRALCHSGFSSTWKIIDTIRCMSPINGLTTIEQALSMSYAISSSGPDFILSVFSLFAEIDQKSANHYFQSLFTLFASTNQHLRLFKLLCLKELRRTGSTNELFRQNNVYIRCIIQFFNQVSADFKNNTVKELIDIIGSSPNWSYDHPKENDMFVVNDLIHKFWRHLINKIDTIHPGIRAICRYLRLLSEREFRQKHLNHRAMFGVFLLRFLFVSLSTPDNPDIDPKKLAKSLQFTKLLAFVGQMSTITGEHQGERMKYNDIIIESFSIVEEFFDKLCQETPIEPVIIPRQELIEAASHFRSFIIEKEIALRESDIDNDFEKSKTDEALSEFITHIRC